jgi:NADPH-dependent curcumin reductase CurA
MVLLYKEITMNTKRNRVIILAKRPNGIPKEEDFRLIETDIKECKEGMVLVKTLYLSVDPYMRGRMSGIKTYISPYELEKPITGGVVGEVIESKSSDFRVGDFVVGNLNWSDFNTVDSRELRKVDPDIAPISTALGILGMPGLTAYFGLLDIGKPVQGETVVISGAAGAVGTVAGQIAKIKGCRVIGIAGSDKKTDYLVKELGFDAAVNYKKISDIKKEIKNNCPNGVDIYFDNVGGEISDAVMPLLNYKARIILCGQISQYNMDKPDIGPRVQTYLLIKSAMMKGFIVMDYADRYEEGIKQLAQWLSEKKLKYIESIVNGLENAPKAFIGLFKGENLGKQLVKVS